MVDALARESRSSVLLLKQASAADLVRDGAWREYLVRRALEFNERNPDVVYEMGALLQQLKRPEEALPYFNRHLDMVSDDQQTLVQIGKCYADLGRFQGGGSGAAPRGRAADDAVGFYNLGLRAGAGGTSGRSRTPVRAGARAESGAGRRAHEPRHRAGTARGRFAEAVAHLAEAVRLEPGSAAAHNNLGGVFLQQRQLDAAARPFPVSRSS